MKKFLLNKQLAEKNQVMVMAIIDDADTELIEYIGEDIPHFITYDNENIREATLKELIDRGVYEIPQGCKYDENSNKIVEMTTEEKKISGFIPLEPNEEIQDGKVVVLSDYELVKKDRKELKEGEVLDEENKSIKIIEKPLGEKVYKWEKNNWVLDKDATQQKTNAVMNEILDLELKIDMMKKRDWDTKIIENEKAELENRLSELMS